eukprot:770650-Amphidinium_carterae.1
MAQAQESGPEPEADHATAVEVTNVLAGRFVVGPHQRAVGIHTGRKNVNHTFLKGRPCQPVKKKLTANFELEAGFSAAQIPAGTPEEFSAGGG